MDDDVNGCAVWATALAFAVVGWAAVFLLVQLIRGVWQ